MSNALNDSPNTSSQSKLPTSRRSMIVIAGVASVVALGIAIPSFVSATQDDEPVTHATPANETLDLENVEVGQLADELDRLGLELHVAPAAGDQDAFSEGDFFDDGDDFDDQFGDGFDDLDEEGVSFGVTDGELVGSSATPEQQAQAESIWGRFTEIIPASQIGMVSGFELMSEEYGGAHVYADESDPTKWILGVSLGIEGEELDSILVHEFGHLLTLNAQQVPPSDEFGSCPTFNPGEGCALRGSTIAEFVEAFWPQSMQDEINRINDSGDWDALDRFYDENSDSFVSDYATTNPVEDLAETFTAFVLEDRPSGNTIANQKVQMLWGDTEMVQLRDEIRSRV